MSAATFRPGDRVRPASEQPNTWRGTVTDVAVYPARLDDDGAVVLPERTVVTVDVDGVHGPGYAFVADDGQLVPLVRLDDAAVGVVNARVHPGWAGVLVADLGVAAGMGKHLVSSVLDDMSRDPADVAANLRALADVLDGGRVEP